MSAGGRRGAAGAICAMVAIACAEPTAPAPTESPIPTPSMKSEPAVGIPVAFTQASRAPIASSAVDDAVDRVLASFSESGPAAELRRTLRLLSGALAGSDRTQSERLLIQSHRALRILQSSPASSGLEAELAAVALALDAVSTPHH
jgi:hypothetical protein